MDKKFGIMRLIEKINSPERRNSFLPAFYDFIRAVLRQFELSYGRMDLLGNEYYAQTEVQREKSIGELSTVVEKLFKT